MAVRLKEGKWDESRLPTQDDLPYSDGIPMESHRHVMQMSLLIHPLLTAWKDRDFFVSGNMFLYYSLDQVRNRAFMGPDVLVALDVPPGERKSWVVWQEGKQPDVVIELLSDTTARGDRTKKKRLYQDVVQVPEYYWYDPFSAEFSGFVLREGVYQPLLPDAEGRLRSERTGLLLGRWEGDFARVHATWLRWMEPDGTPLPVEHEAVEAERERMQDRLNAEARRAEEQTRRAEEQTRRARDERERADRLAAKLRELGVDPDA
jgi:Uma2 family endonuclease